MVDTQRVAKSFQVVLNLRDTLLKSVVFLHVHTQFLGLLVELQQELAVTDIRQNIFLIDTEQQKKK